MSLQKRPRSLASAGAGLIIASALILCIRSAAQHPPQSALDQAAQWQPKIHFSDPPNWINDPNGPIFLDGQYHMFFQTTLLTEEAGRKNWGHAISPDLIHWKHLPLAIPDENGIDIYSGSTVLDSDNTSGLCGEGQSTPNCVIAIYTGASRERQTQNLAVSRDAGATWTKYSGNPVINANLKAFRDPKVFWYAPAKIWIMAVALSDQHEIRIYRSTNLRQWDQAGEFGPAGAVNGEWECPDLFELPIYDEDGKPAGTRWVLSVNVNSGAPAGGSGDQYFVGQFDGSQFTEDHPGSGPHWVDWGKDFYASTSFANTSIEDHLWIAWMNNWQYASQLPPGRGEMTLARRLYLYQPPPFPAPTPSQEPLLLVQQPILGLAADKRYTAMFGAPPFETIEKANARIAAKKLSGDVYRLRFTLDPGDASEAGVRLRRNTLDPNDPATEETVVGVNMANGRIFVDRSHSGRADWSLDFSKRVSAPLKHPQSTAIPIEIVVDNNSIEVFAESGETVLTDLIYPNAACTGIAFYASPTPPGTAAARIRDIEMIPLAKPAGQKKQ